MVLDTLIHLTRSQSFNCCMLICMLAGLLKNAVMALAELCTRWVFFEFGAQYNLCFCVIICK